MTADELIAAGIPLSGAKEIAVLYAEAALDWMQEYTTLEFDRSDSSTIAALPACAKLFVVKYSELFSRKQGVASQSIEGLSQSFDTTDRSTLIWQLARSLLGAYLKSQARFIPARRKW